MINNPCIMFIASIMEVQMYFQDVDSLSSQDGFALFIIITV